MSHQFYSSLVINGKKFPSIHQVFKPRYNKEFFKRITANIDQLEAQVHIRCKAPNPALSNKCLYDLRTGSRELVRLRERLEKIKLESNENESKFDEVLSRLQSIEDRIMPTAIGLPNRSSKTVPSDDTIIDQVDSDFLKKENLSKVLSHRKLSYINNCYSKSVVGPNSHYYFGIGAKLQSGLSDYFNAKLEEENFIPISGLCLTKSAVVEAVNVKESKDYSSDPCRTLSNDQEYTTLHLVEASREALVGFITTIGPITSNDPLRLMTSGAGYRNGTDWFDGNDKHVTQFETVHALVLNSSIEQYSMKEFNNVKDIIWASYKRLELPTRLVYCSLHSMLANEYAAYRIDVWLPSRHEWIQVGRVSHYLDYITVRTGMKRGHLIDSMVYDGQALVAAIIENRQTSGGKFIIPEVIRRHMVHLSQEEAMNYFRSQATTTKSALPGNGVLHNYDQRRYLVKKSYSFGHSEKARKQTRYMTGFRVHRLMFVGLVTFSFFVDWREVWYTRVPDPVRFVLYDFFYRPTKRIWWSLVYEPGKAPPDIAYKDLDKLEFSKTTAERKKEDFMRTRRGEV